MPDPPAIPADLDACAREPIHIPGSIQPHGYLFVLNEADLTVAAASTNAADTLGLLPAALIGRPVADLLTFTTSLDLDAALRSPHADAAIHVGFPRSRQSAEWDALVHRTDGVLLLELVPRMLAGRAEILVRQIRVAVERIPAAIRKSRLPGAGHRNSAAYGFRQGHGLPVQSRLEWPGCRRRQSRRCPLLLRSHLPGIGHPAAGARALHKQHSAPDPGHRLCSLPPVSRDAASGRAAGRPEQGDAAKRIAGSPRISGQHGGSRLHVGLGCQGWSALGPGGLPSFQSAFIVV